MNLSNIDILMNHSLGISDSYYRITVTELKDYLKANNFLLIDNQQKLQKTNCRPHRKESGTK